MEMKTYNKFQNCIEFIFVLVESLITPIYEYFEIDLNRWWTTTPILIVQLYV